MPASIVLVLRVWRQNGWKLQGAWWALVPVGLAFMPLVFSQRLEFFWVANGVKINFLPSVLPIYLYTAGIVLLFAGPRVWWRAWFPLVLLLLVQPVPDVVVHYLDLPLQSAAAVVARSFANFLGFSPRNNELLRLMFTPDFGMFIAPGCDGMRGAVTLSYGALIVGYLKRASIGRWVAYVTGAFLLGHLFNLLRLCALVMYYRVAVGHSALENLARQADYAIGAVLFLIAALLFLWIALRKESRESESSEPETSLAEASVCNMLQTSFRAAALALLVLTVIVPGVRAIKTNAESLALAVREGEVTSQELNERLPDHVGGYKLVRAWQERLAGAPVLESAAFQAASPDEIEIGIWLPPSDHSIQRSMMTQGELPREKNLKAMTTAESRMVEFNTALYDDGVTETLIGDTYCSPSSCQASGEDVEGVQMKWTKVMDHQTRGQRAVPIFFKIQMPHTNAPLDAVYSELFAESQSFLAKLDLTQLSERFQ